MVWGGEFGCEWIGYAEVSDVSCKGGYACVEMDEANVGLQLCGALGEPEYGGRLYLQPGAMRWDRVKCSCAWITIPRLTSDSMYRF